MGEGGGWCRQGAGAVGAGSDWGCGGCTSKERAVPGQKLAWKKSFQCRLKFERCQEDDGDDDALDVVTVYWWVVSRYLKRCGF